MNKVTKEASPHFKLDERLEADCEFVANLGVCSLLLMNNASVPWFILVPSVMRATELTELPMEQQQQVLHEMNQVAAMVTSLYNPDKLNIGALGNVVSQLHIHIIGRFTNDPAWPSPVWGHHFPKKSAVNHLISSDICFRMIQEATTWSTKSALI
jgi:diadenosine tetraphosphate (Ap4A) HIT family hydrolase